MNNAKKLDKGNTNFGREKFPLSISGHVWHDTSYNSLIRCVPEEYNAPRVRPKLNHFLQGKTKVFSLVVSNVVTAYAKGDYLSSFILILTISDLLAILMGGPQVPAPEETITCKSSFFRYPQSTSKIRSVIRLKGKN